LKLIVIRRVSRHGYCAPGKDDRSQFSGFFEEQHMRRRKHISRLLMGGILSVTWAGLIPVVYAQGGGGGGGTGGAAGGAASGGATGSGGIGAPGAPPSTGEGTASGGSTMGGEPTNPVPKTPPSEPGSNMGGSSTGSLGRNPTSQSGPTNPNDPAPGASGPAGSGATQ
jgi:hypothetical protein